MTDFNQSLQDLRESYDQEPLRRSMLADDPVVEFQKWMQQAIDAKVYDPNACSLATVDDSGRPSSRAVLLKGLDAGRFVFYSNYNSRKAGHLEANPNVSMHFPWFSMQRQVTVLGEVSKVEDALAEEYFQSRPYLSRIGAWASSQSQPLDSRETLEKSFLEVQEKFGDTPPRPLHWGGYYLHPRSIEFWQGGPNRLHDRFLYQHIDEQWTITRLNP
jgi:pyridoxamine 5'-phosphate oxidase